MNCLNTCDQNLILQQQLIFHQMLIYTQMLKYSFNQKLPTPKISNLKLEEIDISNSQSSKHDDTNQIQPQQKQSKVQKKTKKQEMKKPKIQNKDNNKSDELPEKKRVFLSMLDIKEVQYKKFKAQGNEDNQKSVTAIVSAQI